MSVVTPLRFVGGVVGLWVAARAAVLLPPILAPAIPADDTAGRWPRPPARRAALPVTAPPAVPVLLAAQTAPPAPAGYRPAAPRSAAPATRPRSTPQAVAQLAARDASRHPRLVDPAAPSPSGILPAPSAVPPPPRPDSRWSGNLYVYRRGDGAVGLASGGQLGGSQAGARIAFRLNRDGPARLAAAARLSTPLDDARGAEGAVGLDWHPLPGRPLRVSIERRVDLGGAARNAWSAYAAGGFYREPRPGLVIDGYAQAGVVGARRRDLFADGALRGGARRDLGGGRSLTLGGGIWGAAQPRVARLDIGPRAAIGLPLGGTAATLAAEWRIRVAGDASPRSGLAITLASDF